MVTDTFYDNAARSIGGNNLYYATGNPAATLVVPTLSPPSSTVVVHDGAGRTTATIAMTGNTELWRTSLRYGGDHVDTTPPAGGTATSTYTDARGHTTQLRQYHGATPTGAYDATSYGYDHAGHMTAMTDAAGNRWSWSFDVLGRRVGAEDPDAGSMTTGYDAAGRVVSTTDARGVRLAFVYDTLDRTTGEYLTSTSGTRLAGWVYDTLSKGQLTSATRYVGADAYTRAVTGYDAAGRPTGQMVTVPASAGVLAGSYTRSLYYMPDGSLGAVVVPAVGGLPGGLPPLPWRHRL